MANIFQEHYRIQAFSNFHLQGPYPDKPKQHYLSTYKAWQSLSVLGVVGTASNLLLLHTFYSEREILASSVNVLIYMDCCHKLLYSALMVPWRNYNMIYREPLFISILGLHEVIYICFYQTCC